MNGPEHYREAERILQDFQDANGVLTADQQIAAMGIAQVHATLAVAAVRAEKLVPSEFASGTSGYNERYREWARAIS